MYYDADKTAQQCYGIYSDDFIEVCLKVIEVQPTGTIAGYDVLLMLLGFWETRFLIQCSEHEVI